MFYRIPEIAQMSATERAKASEKERNDRQAAQAKEVEKVRLENEKAAIAVVSYSFTT